MTTKKRRSATATKSTTTTRRTKAVPAGRAPIAEPPQSKRGLAEATETPPTLIPDVAASNSPTVNETETPAQTEASVETAATTLAAKSPGESVSPANKLSALNAAAKVLDETSQAMSCAELIATMAAKGYWISPTGRTPAGTLYTVITMVPKTA